METELLNAYLNGRKKGFRQGFVVTLLGTLAVSSLYAYYQFCYKNEESKPDLKKEGTDGD